MLKNALAAVVLLSIPATSFGATVASAAPQRTSAPAKKIDKDDEDDRPALYLLGAGVVAGGVLAGLGGSGGNGGRSKSP